MIPRSLLAICALVLIGCGVSDPYSDGRAARKLGSSTPSPTPTPEPATEPPPSPTPASAPDPPIRLRYRRDPERAIERVAMLYGNWGPRTRERRDEQLRRLTTGEARDELVATSEARALDVRTADARSRAKVETIDVRGDGDRRVALVVTRERVTASDLPDDGWRYRVTVATVERRDGRWLVSRWEPQP